MTLWRFTHAPGLAMLLLAAEGAGMALVIASVYRHPGRETFLTWWAFVAAGLQAAVRQAGLPSVVTPPPAQGLITQRPNNRRRPNRAR